MKQRLIVFITPRDLRRFIGIVGLSLKNYCENCQQMFCYDLHLLVYYITRISERSENLPMAEFVSNSGTVRKQKDIKEKHYKIVSEDGDSFVYISIGKILIENLREGGVECLRLGGKRSLGAIIFNHKEFPQGSLQQGKEEETSHVVSLAFNVVEQSTNHWDVFLVEQN